MPARKHIPTEQEGREALLGHMMERAAEARRRHGPDIDADAILGILDDPRCLRHPTTLAFDDGPLEEGEFAYPEPVDEPSGRRFRLCLRSDLEARRDEWARAAAYYIPLINYGPIVTHENCLAFVGALLGEGPADSERALRRLCGAARPDRSPTEPRP